MIKREWFSIGIACAFGALIGATIALELNYTMATEVAGTIGMIAGSLIGYVAVDFKHFCAGVGRAYRETLVWQPNRVYWMTWGYGSLCVGMIALTITFYSGGLLVLFDLYSGNWETLSFYGMVVVPVGTIYALVLGMSANRSEARWFSKYPRTSALRQLVRVRNDARLSVQQFNPISTPITVAISAYKAVARLISGTIRLAPVCVRFTWRAFIYIHSQWRMICLVDAGIGALTGFVCGYAIIGALVGAALGILNYELVSVRWLKLPVRR